MDVHWSAVLRGWLIDFLLSLIIQFSAIGLGLTSFFESPDLSRPPDLVLLVLLLLSTGIGGYAAGRLARRAQIINGFMVGIIGVVIAAILNPGVSAVPRLFVFGQIAGCGLGAVGGYISRFHTR